MTNTVKYTNVYAQYDTASNDDDNLSGKCWELVGKLPDGSYRTIARKMTQGNADMFVLIIGKTGVLPFLE